MPARAGYLSINLGFNRKRYQKGQPVDRVCKRNNQVTGFWHLAFRFPRSDRGCIFECISHFESGKTYRNSPGLSQQGKDQWEELLLVTSCDDCTIMDDLETRKHIHVGPRLNTIQEFFDFFTIFREGIKTV